VAVPGELEELPFGVVPEGELCATAQPEPHTIANVSVASLAGIQVTPVLNLSLLCAESNRSVRHKR
jgi:hypothetical protein